jgi:opacity protein-like surface antigen
MKHIISLFAVFVLMVSTPALASIGEGNTEVGVDFGLTNFDSNTSDETGLTMGVRGGYHFTDLFELEGQIASSSADDEVAGTDVDINATSLFVNGVFNFHPTQNIVPYVLVGIGTTDVEVDVAGTEFDDSATATQAGFGSRFFFGPSKKVAVRVEVSFINEDTFDEDSTHTNILGSLTWKLGA